MKRAVRTDADQTPLMWAASPNEHPDVLRVPLADGADVDARDEEGNTVRVA